MNDSPLPRGIENALRVKRFIYNAFLYSPPYTDVKPVFGNAIPFHDKEFYAEQETIHAYPEIVRSFWRRLKIAYWELMGPDYDFDQASYDPDSGDLAFYWALKWLHKAFENQPSGSEAIFLIGNLLYRNQNYDAALQWYRKAPLWDGFSMIGLGFIYQEGLGVAQDYSEALQWYSKTHEN